MGWEWQYIMEKSNFFKFIDYDPKPIAINQPSFGCFPTFELPQPPQPKLITTPKILENPFLKFKNIHEGKAAILFATGKTLHDYYPTKEDDNAIKVGVNRVAEKKDIELDYLFWGDWLAGVFVHGNLTTSRSEPNDTLNIINNSNAKQKFAHDRHISHIDLERTNSIIYKIQNEEIQKEIDIHPLLNHSIVFSALQFILYTGCSKITLVGCDGSYKFGSWERNEPELSDTYVNVSENTLKHWWWKMAEFIKKEYPKVEVICLNPVMHAEWNYFPCVNRQAKQ